MHWMILPLKRYADFSGRSRRMEYWMFTLFYYGVFFLLFLVMMVGLPWADIINETTSGPVQETTEQDVGPVFWIGLGLMAIFALATIIPSIAVTVRRFHDQNMSGWLYLLNFIPYIGWLIIIVFMFMDGKRGPNEYGDDPKGTGTASVFE